MGKINTIGVMYVNMHKFSKAIKDYNKQTEQDLQSLNSALNAMSGVWKDEAFNDFLNEVTPSMQAISAQLGTLKDVSTDLDGKAARCQKILVEAQERMKQKNSKK